MSEIKKTDIIEPGIDQEVKKINDEFVKLIDSFDKIVIVGNKLDSSLKKGLKSQKELNTANNTAVKNAKSLKESTVKINDVQIKAIKSSSSYLKTLSALNKQKEKSIKENKKLEKTTNAQVGSINKLRYANKKLLDIRNNLDISSKKGLKTANLINKKIDENNKKIKQSQTLEEKRVRGIGKYKEALNSVPGPLGRMGNMMSMIAKNPMILAITAIISAFTLLKKSLKRSEEGQDKLNKIMEVGGAIFGKLVDFVTDFAIILIDAFTKPKQAIKDLWDFLKSQFINRLNATKDFFIEFGNLLKGVWELDTEKIKKAAKGMGNSYIDAMTGVKNTIDKVKKVQTNLTDEMKKTIKAAKAAADIEAKLNKTKRTNLLQNAKIEGEIAVKLAKAEELKKSNALESIKLTKEAQQLQNKILENNKLEAQLELKLLKSKAAQGKNDIEMNNKIAAAQAKLIRAENAYSQKRLNDAKKINTLIAERKRQINEVATAMKQSITGASQLQIEANNKILSNDSATFEAKQKALANNKAIQLKAIKEITTVQVESYKEQLKANLLTQKSFNELEKAAIIKKNAVVAKIKTDYQKNTNDLLKKQQAEEFSQQQNEVAKQVQKEINVVKSKYANNVLTAKEAQSQITKIHKSAARKQIEVLQQLLKAENLTVEQRKTVEQKLFDAKMNLLDEEVTATKKTEEEKKQLRDEALQSTQTLVNESFNFYKALNDAKLNDIEKSQQFELQMAGDNEQAKESINKKYDKKRKELQIKQAKADKAQAMFNIAISTAEAVMAAAKGGPIMMIAMAAIGAVQLAAVAAKPIPEFDLGTEKAPKGGFIAAEKRPEFVTKNGKTTLFTEPTYFDNNWAGAQITSGIDTAQILSNDFASNLKLNNISFSKSDTLSLQELKDIKKAIKSNKTNVIFDSYGITTIYGRNANKITRIDKYIS